MILSRLNSSTSCVFAASSILLSAFPAFADDPAYVAVEMPPLFDGAISARVMNGAGQVSGQSGLNSLPTGSHMFLFADGAGTENLDPKVYELSEGQYMNARGQVAGYGCVFPGQSCRSYPIRYTPRVGLETLGALSGHNAHVKGMNNFGDVVGYWQPDEIGAPSKAFLYTDEAGMMELNRLEVGSTAYANDINDAGTVVGSAYLSDPFRERAVAWEDGEIHELGDLGGSSSRANAINDFGVIVGRAETPEAMHAFMYTPDSGMIDIHPGHLALSSEAIAVNEMGMVLVRMTHFDFSNGFGLYVDEDTFHEIEMVAPSLDFWVSDLNNHGDLVGALITENWQARPFVWTIDAGTVMLDELMDPFLSFSIQLANGINDHGQIIASVGSWPDRSVLLTPGAAYTLQADDLRAGNNANFEVSLATPNAMQHLVYSLVGPGETEVGALGITLDLHQPRLAASTRADHNGVAQWQLMIPSAAQGRSVWVQAAEQGATTPVVFRTVE